MKRFLDRTDAGRQLARRLAEAAREPEALIVGVAGGGLVVAAEVAREGRLPLDVMVVRRIGVPGREALAMGAVGPGHSIFRNERVLGSFHVAPDDFAAALEREAAVLEREERRYRAHAPPIPVRGRTVILVDDGIVTGATVHAALRSLAQSHPRAVVVAAPVISADIRDDLGHHAREVICLHAPHRVSGLPSHYVDFAEPSPGFLLSLLHGARSPDVSRPVTRSSAADPAQSAARWAWHYRTLRALRDHLLEATGDRAREGLEPMEPPSAHGIDFAAETYDRALATLLPANPDEALREVDAALHRIQVGSYGRCESTGASIPEARLRALPWCRTAIDPPPGREKRNGSTGLPGSHPALGR